MEQNLALYTFNRGIISPLALARVDLKRTQLSSELMTNWTPRVLGPMGLRVGTKYLGSSRNDAKAFHIPFLFSTSDTAKIELTDAAMRVWVADALITRPAVSTVTTNGGFDANITNWTVTTATAAWVTGGYLGLTGDGTTPAKVRQTLTVAAGDQNVEHALRIVVQRGPVNFRLGSTSGGDEYINETTLDTGTHSLAFTPTGASVYVEFTNAHKRQVLVDSCQIEGAGVMSVTAPWSEANLSLIRYDQSADIVFLACGKTTDKIGYQQYKIERRATRSWSVVKYYADDGPFDFTNDGPITITPSALSGNVTLTASAALFRSTHVGALFQLVSNGQSVSTSIAAENTFTNAIRVTGVGATQRTFTVVVDEDAAGAATFTLQRSLDSDSGPWTDTGSSWTADVTTTYNDGLDNQIVWYRLGVKTGDYVNGTHSVSLTYTVGSITGVARITDYTSATSVSAEVITDLGGTSATDNWSEGEWSDRKGWPTSVSFHEGRLWFSGRGSVWGSGSDNFYSFNDDQEGDAAPINRTIGSGPVDNVNWILSLSRLMLGAEGSEIACKSSSQDEILTPANFNPKAVSTQGSGAVAGVKLDKHGIFVTRGQTRVFELAIDEEDYEYGSGDMTALIPEVGKPSIVKLVVQRQPDTRVHAIRSDGTVAMMVIDNVEKVLCWCEIETDGMVEDAVVLPGAMGDGEDQVYYSIKRTINGNTKRYLEKWALESNCVGGTLNHQADCYYQYSGVSTATISGLDHLEGEDVVAWANGKDLGTYTVTAGSITLSEACTAAIIGLPYTGQWKSAKLATLTQQGATLNQVKNINHLGLILYNTHYQGLKYGRDFTTLRDLPQIRNGTAVAADTIYTDYETNPIELPGVWDTDARLCLQAQAPRPCTVLAVTLPVESH